MAAVRSQVAMVTEHGPFPLTAGGFSFHVPVFPSFPHGDMATGGR